MNFRTAEAEIVKWLKEFPSIPPEAKSYIELPEDLLLLRTLKPWSGNAGKRLVKAPKVFIRDSGLTHSLLILTSLEDVLGHPVAGGNRRVLLLKIFFPACPMGINGKFVVYPGFNGFRYWLYKKRYCSR